MTINELVAEAHRLARMKGWYDSPRTALEVHMLIVSEIAEATEAVRAAIPPMSVHVEAPNLPLVKPEGELIELADAVIRIADYCGAQGWDLEAAIRLKLTYNLTRPHRHGKTC